MIAAKEINDPLDELRTDLAVHAAIGKALNILAIALDENLLTRPPAYNSVVIDPNERCLVVTVDDTEILVKPHVVGTRPRRPVPVDRGGVLYAQMLFAETSGDEPARFNRVAMVCWPGRITSGSLAKRWRGTRLPHHG